MSTADYTDGGGWAKLDQAGAEGLSEIIGTFSPRTRMLKTRMLLTLYASLDKSGQTSLSYRRLAKRTGASNGQAQRFIEELEQDGFLIRCGEVKSVAGEHSKRRFDWPYPGWDRVNQKSDSPDISLTRESDSPCITSPGKSDSHQRVQSTQNGALCAPAGPGAAKTPPRPDQTATDPALWTKPSPDRPPDVSGGESDG